MGRLAIVLLSAAAAFAADDAWIKVKELKSGTEIRILKHGTLKPIEGKLDEARDSDVVIVVKNEQVAVPKESIDRLDYRPSKPGSRLTSEAKTATDNPNAKPPAGMAHGPAVPGTSYSSNVSIGSKPEFETIYRRAPAAPPRK